MGTIERPSTERAAAGPAACGYAFVALRGDAGLSEISPTETGTNEFERQWRDRFVSFAENADHDAGIAGWSVSGLATRLRLFARTFDRDLAGSAWLDAGCGGGTYARYLAGLGGSVVGIDYSLPTIAKARQRGGDSAGYCVADATRLPFAVGSFDGALCFGVTQAMASSESLVASLASVVRPGGEVWVDALNATCVIHSAVQLWRRMRGIPPHLRYERPANLVALLRAGGATDVRVIWLPMLPTRLRHFQWLLESRTATFLFRLLPPLAAWSSHSFIVCGRVGGQK